MRLIDADKIDFREVFVGNADLAKGIRVTAQDYINAQPTAYVDEVVEQLEKILLNLTFHKDNNSKVWNEAIWKVIGIVKSGMKDITSPEYLGQVSPLGGIIGKCSCGNTVYDHQNFCDKCGAKLDWENGGRKE